MNDVKTVVCPKCDGHGQVWAANHFFDDREFIAPGWGVGTFSPSRGILTTSDHLVTCPFCEGARRVEMRPVRGEEET